MHYKITAEPIDVSGLLERVRDDSAGALLLFAGAVRDHDAGRQVVRLRYEAYEEMAAAKLAEICEEVKAEGEISDVAAVHRVGELGVGEVSVAIAVAAPHRDAAYRASREIIERLKKEVPIWKRETFADGDQIWVEGKSPET